MPSHDALQREPYGENRTVQREAFDPAYEGDGSYLYERDRGT